MKQYKVEITNQALQDMENIYYYIAQELLSPENAIGQYNRISEAILKLDVFPEKNRIVNFELQKTRQLRRTIVDHYSVFYVIENERVIVISVLYSASDIESRLSAHSDLDLHK